jgi:hypothetical protein
MTAPRDEVDELLVKINQWHRVRDVCRIWGCAPEDAARLDTPWRRDAWDEWIAYPGGSARAFFQQCRAVLDIYRTAIEKRNAFCREVIAPQGRWLLNQYEASRLAVIACDAVIALMDYYPAMVKCVAEDAKLMWPESAMTIDVYLTWYHWLDRKGGLSGTVASILGFYRTFATATLAAWHPRSA